MKTLLAMLAVLLAQQVLARPDPATGLEFPEVAGGWIYAEFRSFEPAALGCSYSYKPVLGGRGAITCYVYDKGLRDIGTGASSWVVEKEMREVFAVVKEAWARENATVEEVAGPTKYMLRDDGPALAYYTIHRIKHQGVSNYSISLLTGYNGSFLKLRYTYPGTEFEKAKRDLTGFLLAMLETNRRELPEIFIPQSNGPNKSLQPTATLVMPPAAQEIMPSVAVAEH
jgi:hypothetical protein